MTIVALVCPVARSDDSAFERSANEQAFRFAVSINCGSRGHVRFRGTSDRAGSDACVRAKGDISAFGERPHSAFSIQHNHEVRDLRANLRPPACAGSADERWTRPAVARPCDDNAFAGLTTDNEACFDDANDRETPRAAKNP